MQLGDLELRERVKPVLVDITDTEPSSLPATTPRWCGWSRRPTPRWRSPTSPRSPRRPTQAGAYVVVDNTFATPILQQPLDLGADLVVHSATKYISGHADALMGALVTRDDELYGVLKGRRDMYGAIPGTLEAWLALRGLRTLPLRMERAQANAQELVRRLSDRADVSEVRYPGFGAMVGMVLPNGGIADLVQHGTALWVYATSLGGVESTLERRRRWKSEPGTIPEGLIRLSVGIEDVEDLWEDLSQALDSATG